ncbi:hypothetical protein [Streptomyces tubercidicus]|uniref:hypothetical protein n=1 Tax=Streptomyces tubercidicus TaxID=47759 RepID=UPI003466515D
MPRATRAIALVALTVALAGTAAPAMAGQHRTRPAEVNVLDRHAPTTGESVSAQDRHRQ